MPVRWMRSCLLKPFSTFQENGWLFYQVSLKYNLKFAPRSVRWCQRPPEYCHWNDSAFTLGRNFWLVFYHLVAQSHPSAQARMPHRWHLYGWQHKFSPVTCQTDCLTQKCYQAIHSCVWGIHEPNPRKERTKRSMWPPVLFFRETSFININNIYRVLETVFSVPYASSFCDVIWVNLTRRARDTMVLTFCFKSETFTKHCGYYLAPL